MRCPYCLAEMQIGYVKSSQRIHWGPEKELGAIGNDIHLAKPTWKSMAEGLFVDADFCETCGKIIISLKKEDETVDEMGQCACLSRKYCDSPEKSR